MRVEEVTREILAMISCSGDGESSTTRRQRLALATRLCCDMNRELQCLGSNGWNRIEKEVEMEKQ